jgi:nitrous oxidase accessory protein NosD
MTSFTATPATFAAVLKASQPGDEVLLADGAYGVLLINAVVRAAPGITVKPAPGAKPALSGVTVQSATGVTVQGLEVRMAPAQQYGVAVAGSVAVVVEGLTVHQADNSLAGTGVWVRGCKDVSVRGCDLRHLGAGLGAMDSSGVTAEGNQIHDIGTDGMLFAGVLDLIVRGNHLRNITPPVGAHPDAIQLFATAANPKPGPSLIENNTYERGEGAAAQGVFVENCSKLTIRHNVLRGCMYNAIGLSACATAEITDNFAQGFPDMGTRIIVRGASSDVTVKGNTVEAVVDYIVNGVNPNFVQSGNTLIKAAPAGDDTALKAWQGAKAPPPVVVDPRDAQIAGT